MSKLESNITDGQNYYEKEIWCSIAISLKRIADSMEKASKPPVMNEVKMIEEEYKRWYSNHQGSVVNKP
jgi:hypothetical protein